MFANLGCFDEPAVLRLLHRVEIIMIILIITIRRSSTRKKKR